MQTMDESVKNGWLDLDRLFSRLSQSSEIEEQTRGVLKLLTRNPLAQVAHPLSGPDACPNCGRPCGDLRSPYCGTACREMAAFIRQFRSALATKALDDPDKQAALGQKLWHLLGGGFPRRMPLIPDRVIRQVIAREAGRCQECGASAVTVDHPGSG